MGNAKNISLPRDIWINTKGQYMKESNLLAIYANIKQLKGEVLLNIKGKYMKESDTLAGNAAKISQRRKLWMHTKK